MNKIFILTLLAMACSSTAQAVLLPAYPLNPGPNLTPDSWLTDRYAPRIFRNAGSVLGRTDVLEIGVDQADGLTQRPPEFQSTFYNLQSRKITFAPGQATAGFTLGGSLYIPQAWSSSTPSNTTLNRRSKIYLTLTPFPADATTCPAEDCFYFGGIGFTNANATDQTIGGGAPRIRVLKKGVGDGWINLDTPFRTNNWNDICITYTGNSLQYFLNGALVFNDTPLVPVDTSFGPPVRPRTTNVEAYNFGSTYAANWSNLEYGARAELSISKLAPASAPPGSTVNVSTTVRNNGTTAASNVVVTDPTPPGLALIGVTGDCSALPCSLGTIPAGATRSYVASYTVLANGGAVQFNATVRTDGVDCNRVDNSVTTNVGVSNVVQVPGLDRYGIGVLLAGLTLLAFAQRSRA